MWRGALVAGVGAELSCPAGPAGEEREREGEGLFGFGFLAVLCAP